MGAALCAVLLNAGIAGVAAARKPQSLYSATVNGKKLKASKKVLIAQYSTVAVSLSGGPKPHPTKVIRALGIVCPFNLKTVALPFTLDCSGSLLEQHLRHPEQNKTWTSFGIMTTFESFDGARTTGTFQGTLQPVSGATTPASIENGRFSVVLEDTGL